jgi:hypothetical protein
MSHCTSGCPTKDHRSYGECLRSKSVATETEVTRQGDYAFRSNWQTEIKEYRDARRQGIQPASSKLKDIREAVAISQKHDKPVEVR